MPATDLLTLAEARERVGTDLSDAHLGSLITASTNELEAYCHAPFVSRTVTEDFTGGDILPGVHPGDGLLIGLRSYPVATVTSVTEYDRWDTEGTALRDTDWYLRNPTTGMLTIHHWGAVPRARRFRVTYTAGLYATTAAVDPSLKSACAHLITDRADVMRLEGVMLGDVAENYRDLMPSGLPPSIAWMVDRFRHIPVHGF